MCTSACALSLSLCREFFTHWFSPFPFWKLFVSYLPGKCIANSLVNTRKQTHQSQVSSIDNCSDDLFIWKELIFQISVLEIAARKMVTEAMIKSSSTEDDGGLVPLFSSVVELTWHHGHDSNWVVPYSQLHIIDCWGWEWGNVKCQDITVWGMFYSGWWWWPRLKSSILGYVLPPLSESVLGITSREEHLGSASRLPVGPPRQFGQFKIQY